jgi:hypothetical protein
MSKEDANQIDLLQQVVNETSGTALTISPKEDKWTGYLLQQKENFEAPTLPELCAKINTHILEKRIANPNETKGKRIAKPFKYSV